MPDMISDVVLDVKRAVSFGSISVEAGIKEELSDCVSDFSPSSEGDSAVDVVGSDKYLRKQKGLHSFEDSAR